MDTGLTVISIMRLYNFNISLDYGICNFIEF